VPEPITLTQEELDAKIAEATAAATAALVTKRDELLAETKAAKEAARAVKAQLAEMETATKAMKAGISSQELERLRAEVDGQYRPVVEALKAENRRLKLDGVVKEQMARGGARADRIEALFKLTAGEYDLTDDGQPMLRERPGTPIEKFIAEDLKAQYPEFFDGTGSSGGGAPKSVASGAVRVIPAGDPLAFGKNAADIASGKAEVR
jgi:hypothetical protein